MDQFTLQNRRFNNEKIGILQIERKKALQHFQTRK